MTEDLLKLLACPRDRTPLVRSGNGLWCRQDHKYPIVDGVPILLLDDIRQTHADAAASLARVSRLSETARVVENPGAVDRDAVDPTVAALIVRTNGILYRHLAGTLPRYPIPVFPLTGRGRLLDIGCSWGRWSVAAARAGFRTVGIDPGLDAIQAARRVARQLSVPSEYVVADARFPPFRDDVFDVAFSYSVLQHFSREDAAAAVAAAARVTRPGGRVHIQMANVFGARSQWHQLRRRYRQARGFEVRYWTPGALRRLFEEHVGPTTMSVDGFLSLNPREEDRDLLTPIGGAIVRLSTLGTRASRVIPPLRYFADSLWLTARVER